MFARSASVGIAERSEARSRWENCQGKIRALEPLALAAVGRHTINQFGNQRIGTEDRKRTPIQIHQLSLSTAVQ